MEQNNLITLLPSELLNAICLYLDYTEVSIIMKLFSVDVNYQYLLSNKYPAFYKIVNDVRKKSLEYKDYPYSKGYSLMSLVEMQLKDNILDPDHSNIRTDYKRELVEVSYKNELVFGELEDIFAARDIMYPLLAIKGGEYYKYREYFPNIKSCNIIFMIACTEYSVRNQEIGVYINEFKKWKLYSTRINTLYCMFLYVLDNKLNMYIKEKVQNFKFCGIHGDIDKNNNEKLMYLYIMNYINNNLPKL